MTENNAANQPKIFVLPSQITIETAEDVLLDMRNDGLSQENAVTVDASNAEIITTPGVQVILSLAKTLESKGGKFAIKNCKDSLTKAFETLGLKSELKKWSA